MHLILFYPNRHIKLTANLRAKEITTTTQGHHASWYTPVVAVHMSRGRGQPGLYSKTASSTAKQNKNKRMKLIKDTKHGGTLRRWSKADLC